MIGSRQNVAFGSFAVIVLLGACSAAPSQPDIPAVRTSLEQSSLDELNQVVRSALGGVPVTLAEDALTTSSRLTIEPARHRQLGGGVEPGRSYERPRHFDLVRDGGKCFLVDDDTKLRWLLADTRCEPV